MRKTVTLHGVESTDKTISILEATGEAYNGKEKTNKYTIWKLDREGKPSKAYTQYQSLRPLAGDTFDFEVFEQPKSFVNDKGENIEYTQRTINYFYLDPQGNPTIAPNAPKSFESHEYGGYGQTPVDGKQANPGSNLELEKLKEMTRDGFSRRDIEIDKLKGRVLGLEGLVRMLTNNDSMGVHCPNAEDVKDIPIVGKEEELPDFLK